MKHVQKMFATALTAAVAVTVLAPIASAATTVEYPTKIAALGDSMSQGANTEGTLSNVPQNSWSTGNGSKVNSHYNRLLAEDVKAVAYNDSKSGSKSSDLARQATLAAAQNVDYVTLLSGANDICLSSSPAKIPSASVYKANVRAALTTLNASASKPDVLVASIPSLQNLYEAGKGNSSANFIWSVYNVCAPMLGNPQDVSDSANARRALVESKVQEYNLALKEVCSEFSRCVDDNGAVYNTEFLVEDLAVDYFHPSVSGQNKIAESTWAVAKAEIFTKGTPDPEPTTPPVVVTPTPEPTTPPVVVTPTPEPTTPPVVVTPTPTPTPEPTTPPVVVTPAPAPTTPPVVVTPAPAPTPTPTPTPTTPVVVAPTVVVDRPAGSTISGTVTAKVYVTSDSDISNVWVTIDKKDTVLKKHYSGDYWVYTVNTKGYPNGTKFSISFGAQDADGDITRQAPQTVTVKN